MWVGVCYAIVEEQSAQPSVQLCETVEGSQAGLHSNKSLSPCERSSSKDFELCVDSVCESNANLKGFVRMTTVAIIIKNVYYYTPLCKLNKRLNRR